MDGHVKDITRGFTPTTSIPKTHHNLGQNKTYDWQGHPEEILCICSDNHTIFQSKLERNEHAW